MYQLFRNLQESVYKRSLDSEVSVSAAIFFSKNRLINKNSINEVIRPGTRHAFSQDLEDVNALSAPIALREARPIAIDGGNWRLPNRMFKISEANVELNSPVIRISPGVTRRWMVDFKDITQPNHTYLRSGMEEFDIVILTVPFQSNTIEIEPPFRTLQAPFLKQNNTALPPYMTRRVTLFTSPNRLSPTYFKKPLNFTLPKDILTAPRPDSEPGIFSITMPRRVLGPWPCDCDCDDESEYVYQ